jgi:alpha-glucosidase (family GH31 glycosyl hydrolase)
MIGSKGMRWAGHVARMEKERKCTRFWWESPRERDYSEDRGVDGSKMDLGEIGWRGGV